jgi:type II secretory pathway pseudopilin PulG
MMRKIQGWRQMLKAINGERGISLVESLVTIAIISVTLTAFAVALSTGSLAVNENGEEVVTQSLARSQMEYIKGYPYDPDATTYPVVNAPNGYSISVSVDPIADPAADTNIQKVTANISRDGQVLMTIQDYKVQR